MTTSNACRGETGRSIFFSADSLNKWLAESTEIDICKVEVRTIDTNDDPIFFYVVLYERKQAAEPQIADLTDEELALILCDMTSYRAWWDIASSWMNALYLSTYMEG